MNDAQKNSSGGINANDWLSPGAQNAKLVYFLYLASILLGFTGMIGAIFAFLGRDKASAMVKSHYIFQLRTFAGMAIVFVAFWIVILLLAQLAFLSGGLGGLVIGLISFLAWLIFIATAIWYTIRCIKGLQTLSRNEAIADPNTLLF